MKSNRDREFVFAKFFKYGSFAKVHVREKRNFANFSIRESFCSRKFLPLK